MTRIYEDTITINGTDVKDYVYNYRVTGTKNVDEVTVGTIRLILEVFDILNISVGQEVIIARGITTATDTYLLRGYITKSQEEDGLILISVEGRLGEYRRKLLTYSFDKNIDTEAGNPSKIWANIVEGGGLTASYVDSGTDIIMDKFLCSDSYRFERMGILVKALGWQQRDDYTNNYLRLEPIGYTSFETLLTVGDNIVNIPWWEEDLEPIRNFIKIRGAFEEDTLTETFSGTGAQAAFTVTKEPEITKVTVDGVEQIRGILNSTTTYDFTVDKQLKTFTFVTGSIPSSDTDNVVIEYTYKKPKPVQGKDYASIEKYGQERAEVFDLKDVATVADATLRLKQFLKYLSNSAVKTTLHVIETPGIDAGMICSVVDTNKPKFNNSYIINKITYQYPEPVDILEIGSTDFNINNLLDSFNQRLKVLEQGYQINNEELTHLISLLTTKKFCNRYFKAKSTTANADNCILDHPVQSALDSFYLLGDDSSDVYITEILMPGNNKFEEYVTDEEFYDSASSNRITWDTTENKITFAKWSPAFPVSELISNAISIGIPYTKFMISLGEVSQGGVIGSKFGLTFRISSDGKATWQKVTLNTLTEFTSTVSDIYIKITNLTDLYIFVGSNPVIISAIKDDSGQILSPAIEVYLE